MTEEIQKTKKSESVRIYDDKKIRLERVRRKLAVVEDRNVTEISLLDEMLERELIKAERKLGL